jgi:hypothetical protein
LLTIGKNQTGSPKKIIPWFWCSRNLSPYSIFYIFSHCRTGKDRYDPPRGCRVGIEWFWLDASDRNAREIVPHNDLRESCMIGSLMPWEKNRLFRQFKDIVDGSEYRKRSFLR